MKARWCNDHCYCQYDGDHGVCCNCQHRKKTVWTVYPVGTGTGDWHPPSGSVTISYPTTTTTNATYYRS